MDIQNLYGEIDAILQKIDFTTLFPTFHRYRFALYTQETVCLDGELMPYAEQFMGNTALCYEGEYIAIWNVAFSPVADAEELAASIVHEMFHCHQHTLGEKRFPSDLKLLCYPSDMENYTRKYRENCYLADAYEETDADALAKFAAIRAMRMERYPDMVQEELKAETLEGMAEYVGLKALRQITPEKFEKKMASYLQRLRAETERQFDVRRISYDSGAVFFLCLEKLGRSVQNQIDSDLTAYEQNPIALACGVTVQPCLSLKTTYEKLVEDRKRTITEHIAHTSYTECDGIICGYDPMNMFRVGNQIYCSHIVFLKVGDAVQTHQRAIVLVCKDSSEREIKGYY